ncbi:hypothetical protein H4Q26_009693 [Puccinia striiformis f. sp. tritici PST-130]|nr:hypothetical protein H4Q26_009693 [Puccinia striiformis f. sp. tritici PST-130]
MSLQRMLLEEFSQDLDVAMARVSLQLYQGSSGVHSDTSSISGKCIHDDHLGYNCTFIQSNEYIHSFATATRKVLDVTAAYKLIAAPLIGEEAFFGQTKYMNQVILSKSRTEQLHERLWELTDRLLEIKWAQSLSSGDQAEIRNPEEDSPQELPEILLRSELKELDESILLDYDRGEQSAIKTINEKVEFIAIFIYGFVWAAQTNSAAATIGVVHDILLHDQSQALSVDDDERSRASPTSIKSGRMSFSTSQRKFEPGAIFCRYAPSAHCLNETLRLRATGAWVRLAEKPFHLSSQGTQSPGYLPQSRPMGSSSIRSGPFTHAPPGSKEDSARRQIPIDKKYLIPPTTPSNPYFASWGLGQGHCPGKHLAYKMISMTVARFFDKFEVHPVNEHYENATFEDVAVAGVQRLKNEFTVLIRKRSQPM